MSNQSRLLEVTELVPGQGVNWTRGTHLNSPPKLRLLFFLLETPFHLWFSSLLGSSAPFPEEMRVTPNHKSSVSSPLLVSAMHKRCVGHAVCHGAQPALPCPMQLWWSWTVSRLGGWPQGPQGRHKMGPGALDPVGEPPEQDPEFCEANESLKQSGHYMTTPMRLPQVL